MANTHNILSMDLLCFAFRLHQIGHIYDYQIFPYIFAEFSIDLMKIEHLSGKKNIILNKNHKNDLSPSKALFWVYANLDAMSTDLY